MHDNKQFNRLIFLCLLIVLLIGFWLRVSSLNAYPPGISNDEAVNAIDGLHIMQTGNFPLYQDQGRPEPLYRIFLAIGAGTMGANVWQFRLISAFFGIITLAAAYWATTECLHDVPLSIRKLAGLTAVIVLSVALGHITLSRALYRAIPQPLEMFLAIGFLMRGLRTLRWRDFLLTGIFLALGFYTYTAAFVVPLAFAPLGLSLLIFQRRSWRKWMPRLIFTAIVVAILILPIILLLLNNPQSVIGRASAVAEGGPTFARKLELMIGQFFTVGDENPQYNVANAPLIPALFVPLFILGFFALLTRIRQPSSALIAGLFIFATIPVIATDEITHGLRVIGEFAVFPIIIACAVASILVLLSRLRASSIIHWSALSLIILAGIYQAVDAQKTYVNYWEQANTQWRLWYQYDRELTHSEWFFRTDRRALADWIIKQNSPLLIPVQELESPAMRAWLLSAYPKVTTATESFSMPPETQVLLSWALEQGDFLTNSRQFAFLHQNTITVLPPLSQATHGAILDESVQATEIRMEDSNIPILGKVFNLPEGFDFTYENPVYADSTSPKATFNDELNILNWHGTQTLNQAGKYDYVIDWGQNQRLGHEYGAYVQLVTQDWDKIAGDEHSIHRWLYPTSIWDDGEIVPETYTLDIPDNLPAGAYRLIAGVYYTNFGYVPAQSFIGDTANSAATIGLIKVPQSDIPDPDENAIAIDATLNEQFALTHIEVLRRDDTQITVKLYWKSLVNRPDIDATLFVHAVGVNGEIIAQSDIRPMNGQYPTFIWDEGEAVITEHSLNIADNVETHLIAGMYTQPDFTRLTAIQNGENLPDNLIPLGQLTDLINED